MRFDGESSGGEDEKSSPSSSSETVLSTIGDELLFWSESVGEDRNSLVFGLSLRKVPDVRKLTILGVLYGEDIVALVDECRM